MTEQVATNSRFERAKMDAQAAASDSGIPFSVTIGYDDFDCLAYVVIRTQDLCFNDEELFRAESPEPEVTETRA